MVDGRWSMPYELQESMILQYEWMIFNGIDPDFSVITLVSLASTSILPILYRRDIPKNLARMHLYIILYSTLYTRLQLQLEVQHSRSLPG